ncbi:MAG: TIR domain-containing protein [Gammaproteobacteria bacterium]|nr:TIR domain-containing protein [Gammaproteobacteria bacterium]
MSQESSFLGSPFEWDVFISYSHGKTPPHESESQLRCWTTAFVSALTEDLHHALNSPVSDPESTVVAPNPDLAESVEVKIWYDLANIDGNDTLTKQLREGVQKSSLLVIVMTPDYLGSRWCHGERDSYHY